METLQSIRKYWQYYRPIAPRTLFWPNSDSFMSSCVLPERRLRRMNYKRPAPIVGSNQPVSETNKYGGKSHGNCERTYQTHTDERTCETRTDSPGPAVACILARHDRQSADQRHGPGNGQAVPGSHQRSRGRRASQGRGLRQRSRRLLLESLGFYGQD